MFLPNPKYFRYKNVHNGADQHLELLLSFGFADFPEPSLPSACTAWYMDKNNVLKSQTYCNLLFLRDGKFYCS